MLYFIRYITIIQHLLRLKKGIISLHPLHVKIKENIFKLMNTNSKQLGMDVVQTGVIYPI